MKKSPPSFDFYPSDYLGNTRKFTCEDHGAYLMLLLEQWQEGQIPKSVSEQMILCGISDEDAWSSIWNRIGSKFAEIVPEGASDPVLVNERMYNDRLNSLEKYHSAVKRAQLNGKKGGRPRKPKSVLSETQVGTELGFSENPSPEGGRGKREVIKKKEAKAKSDPPKQIVVEVIDAWNEAMDQSCRTTNGRSKAIATRMATASWHDEWRQAIDSASRSSFCRGQNDRGWRADLDWFLKPDTVPKLLEGKYDDRVAVGGTESNGKLPAPKPPPPRADS